MKKEDLSAAMTYIAEKYIEEADMFDMKNRNKIKRPLSKIAIAAIIAGCILFSCVAYAGISYIDWDAYISFFDDNGVENKIPVSEKAFFKVIPEDIPIVKEMENKLPMLKDDVEKILKFDILGSSLCDEYVIYNYDTLLNKKSNTVARVDLWCPEFIKIDENKNIDMSVHILSTNAEEGFIIPFIEGIDAAGGKVFVEEYLIASLNTKAVIYTVEDVPTLFRVAFVYDDIYYELTANNYNLSEFKEVLESLSND